MNSRYIIIAAFLVAQNGCTSYYELTREEIEKGMIPSETALRITRNDSSIVESGAYRHALVREPTDFVIGSGSERQSGRQFAGKVPRSEIDSTRQIEVVNSHGVQETFFICWLRTKTSLAFKEYDFLNITAEDPPGLWCAGTVTDRDQVRPFKGRIDPFTINRIEAKGMTLIHPSPPSFGESEEERHHWLTLGLGIAPSKGAAFLAGYSLLSKTTLYSGRFITIFPAPLPEQRSRFFAGEVAALFGLALKSRFFMASVSGGISYLQGSEESKFSTIGFPLDLEVAIAPLRSFGVAAKIFSTPNSKKSWNGFLLSMRFGEL